MTSLQNVGVVDYYNTPNEHSVPAYFTIIVRDYLIVLSTFMVH